MLHGRFIMLHGRFIMLHGRFIILLGRFIILLGRFIILYGSFLNEILLCFRLNEILYPHYSAARVMEIIDKYETDENIIAKNGIGKEGFTRYVFLLG